MEAQGNSPASARIDKMRRRRLVRDLIRFQAKLLIDALKDLLLSPVAIIAAVMDFLQPQMRPDMRFYRVLAFGRRIETRIDLFGVGRGSAPEADEWTVDAVLDQVETRIEAGTRKTRNSDGEEP
ncbi:MAG: hypothetical protein WBN65_10200 [Gammaproteobacteria bacterium]